MYPYSFDMLGSLKEEFHIKIDPTVPLAEQMRRKVPIKSTPIIEEELDYMVV